MSFWLRRLLPLASAVFALALIITGAVVWWLTTGLSPDPENRRPTTFIVTRGEDLDSIAHRLEAGGLINNALHFKSWVYLQGLAPKIQSGSHRLAPSMKTAQIVENLTKGSDDRWATIIEGWRQEQIAESLLKQGFNLDLAEWVAEVHRAGLEGKLFPDTYLLPKEATSGAIVRYLKRNFEKKVSQGLSDELAQSDLSLEQVLTIASLVEREARDDQDRPVVAGIILKRWQADWPLQIDASVQYAVASARCLEPGGLPREVEACDWWPKKLTSPDLQIRSAYNTYLNPGLPPGPIGNPGLSAIKAVLNYQETPYWYYLHDAQGQIYYARTSEEHATNIARYLRN